MAKLFLLAGSLNAALCIVLGAFAAHALKAKIAAQSLSAFQTGVQYHFYHSLGLILLGILMLQLQTTGGPLKYAGFSMLAGIVLFSGSLYALSALSWKWLGPVTPLGGLAFIVAWLLLVVGVLRSV
jgi:uncharacterized membrane protein YgdD (TMEM256/DUF423 family)